MILAMRVPIVVVASCVGGVVVVVVRSSAVVRLQGLRFGARGIRGKGPGTGSETGRCHVFGCEVPCAYSRLHSNRAHTQCCAGRVKMRGSAPGFKFQCRGLCLGKMFLQWSVVGTVCICRVVVGKVHQQRHQTLRVDVKEALMFVGRVGSWQPQQRTRSGLTGDADA